MATEDLTTQTGWDAFVARHRGLSGEPSKSSPDFVNDKRVADPFYKYTFNDGSSIEINGAGQIQSIDEKAPSAATGTATPADKTTAPTTKQYTVTKDDGSTDTYQYIWDPASQQFKLDTNFPPEHKPPPAGASANRPPTDPSKWVPVHADPTDPSSRVIALQDPNNSSNRISVPEANPTKPTVVQGPNGSIYSWDGSSLNQLLGAQPDKRQIVQGPAGAIYSWDGTNLSTIKPGEQPKNGDTYQTVENGRFVTKTYQNGQWGTTQVGASATPGAPQEGQGRDVIQNGYNTHQVYEGGEWVTKSIGSKAQPTPPVQVSAGADQPMLTTYNPDTGKYTQQPNAGYIPKTPADVAARVSQLQQAAQQQRDQLAAQVSSGALSSDKAAAQFDQWWGQNVEPQKAALQAAQQQAVIDQQQKVAEQQRLNLSTAQAAGQTAVTAAQNTATHQVGPGYAAAMGNLAQGWANARQGKFTAPLSGDQLASAFVTQAPDYSNIYEQATAQALAHISPTAAQIAGGPGAVPSMLAQPPDISQQLNRTQYDAFGNPSPAGGGGPPATLSGAAPGAGAPGGGTMNVAAMPGAGPQGQQSFQLPSTANLVPGQNYGAATAYTGGVPPWLANPQSPYVPMPYVPSV